MKTCAICGKPLDGGVVVHSECVPKWRRVTENEPGCFISVQGFLPDEEPFPQVRECYRILDNKFYFPALGELRDVEWWIPFSEPPKEAEQCNK